MVFGSAEIVAMFMKMINDLKSAQNVVLKEIVLGGRLEVYCVLIVIMELENLEMI